MINDCGLMADVPRCFSTKNAMDGERIIVFLVVNRPCEILEMQCAEFAE